MCWCGCVGPLSHALSNGVSRLARTIQMSQRSLLFMNASVNANVDSVVEFACICVAASIRRRIDTSGGGHNENDDEIGKVNFIQSKQKPANY